VLGVWLAACSGKRQESDEQQRIAAAIDAIQAVPAEDASGRAELADALAKVDVKTPAAVKARDACAGAYRAMAKSTRLIDEASAGLAASSHADPARTIQAAKEAVAAEKAAEDAMETCSDARAALLLRP